MKPKRLKVEDPRIGKKYISKVKAAFNKAGLFAAIEILSESATKGWSAEQESEYNRIHKKSQLAFRKEVEKRLQKK